MKTVDEIIRYIDEYIEDVEATYLEGANDNSYGHAYEVGELHALSNIKAFISGKLDENS